MRIFLSIVVLIFSLQSWTKADDIRDFEIEGMSVGDSALDYFSETQINSFLKIQYPSSDKFIGYESNLSYNTYDAVSFHFKKKDKNYKVFSLKGIKNYNNKLNICRKEKKKIVLEIENTFDLKNKKTYTNDFGGKSGKSIAYITDFELSKGGFIRIWCTNWDSKTEKEKGWKDSLNVGVSSQEFMNWLNNEAYK